MNLRIAQLTAAFFLLLLAWQVTLPSELPKQVRTVLAHRGLPDDSLSVYIEKLDAADALLSWKPDTPKNPASVMKMLTTLAALDILGPAYQWDTEIYLLGDLADGVLDGDLLIRGTGDPYLVTERFWKLLRRLRQEGVREIRGDLLIDDSYFNVAAHDPAAFDNEPLRAYNVGPNALLVNYKVVRYFFSPNSNNASVNIQLDPMLDELRIVNKLSVSAGSCRGYQRGITVTMNETLDQVTFSGRFPAGCARYAMDRSALSHNHYVYALFTSLWQESGGKISGGWRNAEVPYEVEPDIVFESVLLSDVIRKINKHSNNVMARQLLLTLAAESTGEAATEAAGRDVVMRWLLQRGMAADSTRFENGAGLSRDVRLTTKNLVGLLRYGYESRYMPEYLSSLSLSGLDGTLSRRFLGNSLKGRAHMKTGSIDDVSAIAGYFQARSGNRYLVAVLQNHKDIHRGPGEEVQAALLAWLNRQ